MQGEWVASGRGADFFIRREAAALASRIFFFPFLFPISLEVNSAGSFL
jgi:hypothetical protein